MCALTTSNMKKLYLSTSLSSAACIRKWRDIRGFIPRKIANQWQQLLATSSVEPLLR
jgi:hypothetical protein